MGGLPFLRGPSHPNASPNAYYRALNEILHPFLMMQTQVLGNVPHRTLPKVIGEYELVSCSGSTANVNVIILRLKRKQVRLLRYYGEVMSATPRLRPREGQEIQGRGQVSDIGSES